MTANHIEILNQLQVCKVIINNLYMNIHMILLLHQFKTIINHVVKNALLEKLLSGIIHVSTQRQNQKIELLNFVVYSLNNLAAMWFVIVPSIFHVLRATTIVLDRNHIIAAVPQLSDIDCKHCLITFLINIH